MRRRKTAQNRCFVAASLTSAPLSPPRTGDSFPLEALAALMLLALGAVVCVARRSRWERAE